MRPQGLRRKGPRPVPAHVELDVLRQGADVAARADVVIHHSGDGGVIESLWDPLELHGRHLPSLRLPPPPPPSEAPALLRSELLSGSRRIPRGGGGGGGHAGTRQKARGCPDSSRLERRAAGAGPRGKARQRNGASSAEASHSGSASTPGLGPAAGACRAGLRVRGVMTSAHADAPEGRNAAGKRLGKEER